MNNFDEDKYEQMNDFEKYSYLQNIIDNKAYKSEKEKNELVMKRDTLWRNVQVTSTRPAKKEVKKAGSSRARGGSRKKSKRRRSKRSKSKKRKTKKRKSKRRS